MLLNFDAKQNLKLSVTKNKKYLARSFFFLLYHFIRSKYEKTEIIFTKEGRKEMVISLKNEMKKAIEKENYLDEEERVLINKFIEKIRNELKESN